MRPIVTDVPCSMYLSIGVRGVVVNFDLGERFPRTVSPPPAGNFFEIFDAKSRVWRQFGPENKLIECQPNEYDVICRNASVLAFHLRPTIFAGAPFRIQNICLNGVPPRSRTTTPPEFGVPVCLPAGHNRSRRPARSSIDTRRPGFPCRRSTGVEQSAVDRPSYTITSRFPTTAQDASVQALLT